MNHFRNNIALLLAILFLSLSSVFAVVTSTTTIAEFEGDGLETDYDFSFKYFNASDIKVYVDDALVDTADYTLTMDTDGVGGTIAFDTAPADAAVILIERDIQYTQETRIPSVDKLARGTLENAFDKVTMLAQQLNTDTVLSIKLHPSRLGAFDSELPATMTADKAILVNSTGDGFTLSTSDFDDIVTDATTQATAAASSASSAATSASTAATSATAASTSATAAASSATAAAASAATVNLPTITGGDALKYLRVNAGETGYDHVTDTADLGNLINNASSLDGDNLATGDEIGIYDTSAANEAKITYQQFTKKLVDHAEAGTVITTSDSLVFNDASDNDTTKQLDVATVISDLGLGSGRTLISTQTASASATIDFTTGIDGTYDRYEIEIVNLVPATDATQLQALTGSGSFETTGYESNVLSIRAVDGNTANVGGTAQSVIDLTGAGAAHVVGNGTNEQYSGTVILNRPSETGSFKQIKFEGGHMNESQDLVMTRGQGTNVNFTGALDRIRFQMSSGNITSGTFRLYGLR